LSLRPSGRRTRKSGEGEALEPTLERGAPLPFNEMRVAAPLGLPGLLGGGGGGGGGG